MALIKWTPLYDPFADFDRAFDVPHLTGGFNPAVDLYEKGDDLIVEIGAIGIDPKNVTINIEDNVLSVEGSTEKKSEVDEKNYYRKEIRSGSFHRVISLPAAVRGDAAKAEFARGVLKITMPKREEHKSRPIQIEVKDQQ